MTTWLSMPTEAHRLPISLAKLILTACQQLLAYFTISAVRIGMTCGIDGDVRADFLERAIERSSSP